MVGLGITTTSMCTRFIFFLLLSCANAANLFNFPSRRTSLIRSGEVAALFSSIESSSDNTPRFWDKSKRVESYFEPADGEIPAVTSNYKAPPIDTTVPGVELQMDVTAGIAGESYDEDYEYPIDNDTQIEDDTNGTYVLDDGVDFWTELDDENKPDFQGAHDSIVIGENLLLVHAPMDV